MNRLKLERRTGMSAFFLFHEDIINSARATSLFQGLGSATARELQDFRFCGIVSRKSFGRDQNIRTLKKTCRT